MSGNDGSESQDNHLNLLGEAKGGGNEVTKNDNGEKQANLRFEYEMAQDMLKHYDQLNWLIGSILIGGALAMTGLVIGPILSQPAPDTTEWVGLALCLGIPAFSLIVLKLWQLWFKRHKELYDLRTEVFHRIEIQLKMYHWLRCAEYDIESRQTRHDDEYSKRPGDFDNALNSLRTSAENPTGAEDTTFKALKTAYHKRPSTTRPGHDTATWFVWVVFFGQLALLASIWLSRNWAFICKYVSCLVPHCLR